MPGADDRDPLVAGPRLDQPPDRPASLTKRGCGSGGAKMLVHGHYRQVRLGPQRDQRHVMLWSMRSPLLNARVKPASMPSRSRYPDSPRAGEQHSRRPTPFVVVEVPVVERCLPDQELPHLVERELMEVIGADHHDTSGRPWSASPGRPRSSPPTRPRRWPVPLRGGARRVKDGWWLRR